MRGRRRRAAPIAVAAGHRRHGAATPPPLRTLSSDGSHLHVAATGETCRTSPPHHDSSSQRRRRPPPPPETSPFSPGLSHRQHKDEEDPASGHHHHYHHHHPHLLESEDGAVSDSGRSDISVMVTRRSRRHGGLVRQQTFSIVPTSGVVHASRNIDTHMMGSVSRNSSSPSLPAAGAAAVASPSRPVSADLSLTERRTAAAAAVKSGAASKRPLSGPPTVLKSPKGTREGPLLGPSREAAADFRRYSHASCHNHRVSSITTTPVLDRRSRGGGGHIGAAEVMSPPSSRDRRLF